MTKIAKGQSTIKTKKCLIAQAMFLALSCSSSLVYAAEQEKHSNEFEVIEVTSQKRVQNVMKVPITVGTISADTLEESSSILLSDVDKFIPGFDFGDNSMTQSGISMRGISSPNISSGGDPSSATFYDGVYMPRAAQNVLFSDIERIEVLKGPQGTLFGRNAAMGVVNILPRKPTEDFEGFIKGSWGTDNLARYEGMVNVPLSQSVYLRANMLTNSQDGFVKNISEPQWNQNSKIWDSGARHHNAARVALLWEVSGDTEFQFSIDLDDLEQAPPLSIGLSQYAYNGGKTPFAGEVENDVRDGVESRDMYGVTAKLDHQFNDELSMKYLISYRDWETINRQDDDGTGDITRSFSTSNNEDSSILYTELQFNYVNKKFNAVAGFSYSKEDVAQQTELNVTADTITRLTTGELNNVIRGSFAQELAAAIGGNSDAHAQGAFGPGATFDGVVEQLYQGSGFPLDHIWNSDEWAGALNALGFADPIMAAIGMGGMPLSGAIVSATGDLTYDIVSQQLGIAEIFGPSYSGQFWQENIINTGDFTNWGLYFDVDYAITEKWHVLGGVRYSKDTKDFSWTIPETTFVAQRPGVGNQLFPMVDITASDSWGKVTGRLVTNYELTDDQMIFASYSTGYKSGGFDSLVPINQAAGGKAFAPEDSANLEFGYKAVLNKSLSANISIYNTQLDNFQISIDSKQPGSPTAVPSIINENREVRGLEIDLRWLATDELSFGIVSDFRKTDVERPSFYDANGDLRAAENSSFDASANYTAMIDWAHDFDFGLIGLHADYVYVENTNDQSANLTDFQLAVKEYFYDKKDINMRLSWTSGSEALEAGLWVRNLTDERYIEGIGGLTANVLGTPYGRINRGREVGLDFKYNF
ncbi:TonB-dependent receptor [Paraglaciecola hydrolytica]|uniref:Iron transporter n=1 Tax=Paraglaciecola hydrolytica TaxID=1799789 RepID=A0A136A5X3_9ALTE|nr:TonB-dependent receptor [Paraglaciecola hydrolytica]KXI30645.1 iron transporter [Paraglaciecola hydrolytica]